jgi:RNA polymerase sigma-70 factor, ECF subfamily
MTLRICDARNCPYRCPSVTIAIVPNRLLEIVRSVRPRREIQDDLEPLLVERAARAVAAWPTVNVEQGQFVRAIAERLEMDAPISSIGAMHTDDLYLACGCVSGDAAALVAFELRCGRAIAGAIAATGAAHSERADLGQVVRQRLLVAPPGGGPPRIASYSARGSLPAWVRVVATREAARRLLRAQREVGAEDDELADLIADGDDPEVGYVKRLYREEFRRAFHAAVQKLDARARLVLRQHAIDGLSIDALAVLHGVHRATAARWIQGARAAVLAGTQRELTARLRLTRTEVESVIRLIQSQLDVTLPSLEVSHVANEC